MPRPPAHPLHSRDIAALAAELERFDALMRSSGSATATLTEWMRARAMRAQVDVVAHVRADQAADLPAGLAQRLKLTDAGSIAYRRVWLSCEGRVLSVAENWFVPERLTSVMRQQLAAGKIPFGNVIKPFTPVRRTLSSRKLWSPSDEQAAACSRLPTTLLHHHAIVSDRLGLPICEVSEIYTRNILR